MGGHHPAPCPGLRVDYLALHYYSSEGMISLTWTTAGENDVETTVHSEEKVLLVDDEARVLQGLRRHLGRRFNLVTSTGGREGLARLSEKGPVAVGVVDYSMPIMNGLEFIAAAAPLNPETVWIMLTGYADVDVTLEAINQGSIFRFLTKPCPNRELIEAISQGLEHHLFLRQANRKEEQARETSMQALLAALKERDHITEGHAQRMCALAQELGTRLRLAPEQLSSLYYLSYLHDLGKIGVPDEILFKKEPLTSREWDKMCEHTEKGYRIALATPDLRHIAGLILKHHERWDGTGYPLGLRGEKIPIEARILAVVDSYDAMTNDRPYRKAMTNEEALQELRKCSGAQFDPRLVRLFLEIVG